MMDELVSKQDVILMYKRLVDYEHLDEETFIENVKALPPAQPEKRTEERTKTHTCDLIKRQDVIDTLSVGREILSRVLDEADVVGTEREKFSFGLGLIESSIKDIEELPPAQPKIILCKDCKHWTQSMGKMNGYGLGRCDFHDANLVACNDFCYWAERRTDDGE